MKQALLLLAALGILASCASASRSAVPAPAGRAPVARLSSGLPAHVAVIVMENEEYGDVLGSSAAPFINHLARTYGLASNSYAISHPSLPNYLALTGGSTFGIDSDCSDCSVSRSGLADQLDRQGISWTAYMEDLPQPCFLDAGSGDYAKKHDPFAYFTSVASDSSRCQQIVPLSQLSSDEAAGALPRFVWITPNLCHDMHDCDVSTGDSFLSRTVPPLLQALGPHGLLFLTWDEGSSDSGCCHLAHGGHVVTIVAGGVARRHARLSSPVDHYSLLQTVEDLFGLSRLRGAACGCTPSLAPLLRASARPH
jgi:hypothetical protein